MATYRSIITNAGASLLSYQLAHGGSVNIYRAAAGNGIPSGDPRQLTTLVSEQPSLNIDLGAKQFIDGNPSVVIIPVQINNAGITVPTAIREIGLFAEDPNGEEILFAYSYIDGADTDNILPPPQVTNPEQQFDTVHTHDIILFITSDENAVISVTYTPSNFVSQLQLVEVTDGLQSNINSHASSKQTHGISGSYYIAKTSRSDQLPAWDDIAGKPSVFSPAPHTHSGADITSAVAFANDADKLDGHHAADFALAKLNPYVIRIKRSNPDAYGNYLQVDYYRKNGTLFARSVLSGGTPPQYTTRTITIYDTDGTTVVDSYTFTITYDANGNPVDEW